ncbi:hypothetical protein AZI87_17240, partial [Bdellovibrio bacteriovorus]
IFNSFAYAIFLPTVFLLYYVLPHKFRNVMLLGVSYYFYMSWNYKLIVLILSTTVVSYFAAKCISKGINPRRVLIISTFVCLGMLGFFKYFNFFSNSITSFLRNISLPVSDFTLDLILPVGISFYTFQTLSYVVDVFKGRIPAESNFIDYALYVSFFPQLVAGPIERPESLIPQFKKEHSFDYDKAVYGAKLIALGAFKKIVIADTLASHVNMVYNNLPEYKGFSIVLATFFFAVQIYCDFSGYTDIALGSAKLLGFDLMQNFNAPYLAKSVKDFWSRWHISLSTWFKDYVYIPLGGSKVSSVLRYRNLFITFLLSGLWHGANWTFVLWGAYHGILNIIEALFQRRSISIKLPVSIKVFSTFMLVCVGWVLFRANKVDDAVYVFQYMFDGIMSPINYLEQGLIDLRLTEVDFLFLMLPICILLVVEIAGYYCDVLRYIERLAMPVRFAVYFAFVYTPIFYFYYQNSLNAPQPFIYFQF